MIIKLKHKTTLLIIIICFVLNCQSKKDSSELSQNVTAELEVTELNNEEQEIKSMIEKFLVAAGNYDFETMDEMISDKANLGIAIVRDSVWKNSVYTIKEYFESAKTRELKPYFEPVNDYKIFVNKGQIAFVWADATLYTQGVARTNNIDNFTLIKEEGVWKFINLSFTNTRLPEAMRKFNLEVFAKSYAQVWCSQRPGFVSSFFAEDGELTINGGKTSKGTIEITEVVKGFMDAFPDMVVSLDSLETKSEKTLFHWTLEGTHLGTGNKVKISGFEEWTINDNGLIQNSNGYFDEKDYQRQLEYAAVN